MNKKRIVFLCHFSNPIIRKNIGLKSLKVWNYLAKMLRRTPSHYDDFAIWVSDYIKEFEKHPEYDFHVVSPHKGMIKKRENFEVHGIHYHFFKCNRNRAFDYLNVKLHINERNNYRQNRKIIMEIVKEVAPNLIILCGAENPYYSCGILGLSGIPIYVILQTLLNDPRRIEMGVGNAYRRKVEIDIFKHARYFCTSGQTEIEKIRECNPHAIILQAGFPTHRPIITLTNEREYEFVFFARIVKINKGIEDLLNALSIVVKTNNSVRLNIIGAVEDGYKKVLTGLIDEFGITNNIHFSGYFQQVEDTYKNVAKAKVVVVPGITAGLNSTIRESMLIGMPTICYETTATTQINADNICLLTAPMEDVEALANQMQFAITCSEQAREIAENGKAYAESHFSNEAIVNKLLDNCGIILNKENNEKDTFK